jgi:regulator of sigma E protease
MTIVIFIIVLAVLIFVHELGHFIAARIFGIRVDAFAIGFGPKILSWRSPSKKLTTINDTEYSIRLIPFGGYVKIFGENPDADSLIGPDAPRSFVNKPRWQQAIVLASGVLCNFIFAWILYAIVFTTGVASTSDIAAVYPKYVSNERILITEVLPDSPAERVGLKVGDAIKGFSSPEDVQKSIQGGGGKSISLNILSSGKEKIIDVTPNLPFYISIWEGFKYTGMMIRDTAMGLAGFAYTIIRGIADYSQVSGPVGIAGIVGDAASLGLTYLVMVTAIISINLGVINLVPFPALDGGRILVVAIESIIRRRVLPRYINIVNAVGFALLIALMVFVTYQDIAKLVR